MRKLILFTSSLVFFSAQAFAAGNQYSSDLPPEVVRAQYAPQNTTTAPTPASTTTRAAQPATASSAPAAVQDGSGSSRPSSSGPSINPAAAQGQGSQGAGAAANLAAGAMMIASAIPLITSPEPSSKAMGAALIAMAVLGAIPQGGHDAASAEKSQSAYNSSLDGTGTNYSGLSATGADTTYTTDSLGIPTNPSSPGYQKGINGFISKETKKANDALAGTGYSVAADGLHNPDGSVTPAAAFSSPGAMAAAGVGAGAVKEAEKILAKVDPGPAYKGLSTAVDGGGGGGGSGSSSSSSSHSDYSNPFAHKNPFKLTNDDKRKIVAGKTVLFDGEPIGVRGQNIFDMVHTCYERKRGRNDFIENTASYVPVRAPASLAPANLNKTR